MGLRPYKRIIISLPPSLIESLDEAARQQLMTRTGYIRLVLQEAANNREKVLETAYHVARQLRLERYLDELMEKGQT